MQLRAHWMTPLFQNQTFYFENVANRFSLCYGFDVVSSGALIRSNGDF